MNTTDKKETQLTNIRQYLLTGKYITPLHALREYGCFRLSSVIHRLRHDEDMPIDTYTPATALSFGIISKDEYTHMASDNFAIYHINPEKLSNYKSTHKIAA